MSYVRKAAAELFENPHPKLPVVVVVVVFDDVVVVVVVIVAIMESRLRRQTVSQSKVTNY